MAKMVYFRTPDNYVYEIEASNILATDWATKYTKLSPSEGKAAYRQQSVDRLKSLIQRASAFLISLDISEATILSVVRSVAKSGMTRHIDFFLIVDGQLLCITGDISAVLGIRIAKTGGLFVQGCGMDMAYHIVDSVQRSISGLPRLLHRAI